MLDLIAAGKTNQEMTEDLALGGRAGGGRRARLMMKVVARSAAERVQVLVGR